MSDDRYRLRHACADIGRDIDAYLGFAAPYHPSGATRRRRLSAFLMPSVVACALYRLSHVLHCAGWSRSSLTVARLNLFLTGVSITPASRIGAGLYIPHPRTGVVFQGVAGEGLSLLAGSAVCASFVPLHRGGNHGSPILGDDVSVGAMAVVLGPIRVGSGVRIGFNACVRRDVPAGCMVVPRTLRTRARSSTG